jgi:type IV pilus secretin PilQ/predicted competence protein
MRKNWFSVHVAAAVAAPFLIVLNAHVALAQNGTASVTNSGDSVVSSADTITTTTTTTGTQEEGAPLGAANPTNLDSASPISPALPGDEVLLPLAAMGDDALPSLHETRNNPYARSHTAGLETGRTAGDQEIGAFIPPPAPKAPEAETNQDNSELRTVLGDEVYNRRVNISTQANTDVEEVIRILAEKADLNFVYGEGVIKGKITLNLKDVPLGVALQSLLSTQDLAIVREGENVMRIAPRKELKPGVTADMRTVYIKLNWVPAAALTKTLTGAIHGSGGNIQAHDESNTLIITDTPSNVSVLRDLVAQLDVPEKQVMIEARMVELLLSAGRELGSQTSITHHDGSGNSPLDTGSDTGGVLEGIVSGLGGAAGNPQLAFGSAFSILGNRYNLAVALDGLERHQMVHTLANPKIITLNNQEANIEITRDIPYVESGQGPTQNSTVENVEFKQSSVKLNVLPVITNNGYVRMKLEPTQEIFSGFDTITGRIPIIDTRSAITNVIVKDEDTVVLGGLRQISAQDTKREYPWLAKSPVLGWFFKGDNKIHEKNDLMLFVTPHIVKAPTLTPAENYKYTRIDAHWDLPDYFFDDSVDQRESHHRFEADMDTRNFYQQDLLLPMPPDTEGAVNSSAASYGANSDLTK